MLSGTQEVFATVLDGWSGSNAMSPLLSASSVHTVIGMCYST